MLLLSRQHCGDCRAKSRACGAEVSHYRSLAKGMFGPVREEVLPRIGDVLVNATADIAIVDSVRMRPELLRLVGLHGSVTPAETSIPLFVWPARIA